MADKAFVSLDFTGEDNLPGIARAYVVPSNEIETFAEPVADPTTGEGEISIVGDHTLKSGKYFTKMYSTQGKGTLNFTTDGERDFENFKQGGELFFPSTKKEALAMSAALKGRDCIVLLEENSENDGYHLQVGTRRLPARLKPAGDWGTNLDGIKGITFTIEAFSGNAPVYLYSGIIPLSASEVIQS